MVLMARRSFQANKKKALLASRPQSPSIFFENAETPASPAALPIEPGNGGVNVDAFPGAASSAPQKCTIFPWMANHEERLSVHEPVACGGSFTLLGRKGRCGAEALAASVLALRTLRVSVRRSPPEHAGPVI